MKARSMILVVVVSLLFLGTGALAQPGGPYAVEQGMASGGGYHLTSLVLPSVPGPNWQVSGAASGGNYRLSAPRALASTGSGCCCTYLPCAMRSYRPFR
jgi:hypothetical protein